MSKHNFFCILLMSLVVTEIEAADDYPLPPINAETSKFQYQDVVILDSTVSKSDIYSYCKAWIAINYKQAKDVIQLDDSTSGKIIVKGNIPITYYTSAAWVNHMLIIEMKDGRYRYTLTDFVFDNGQWSSPLEDKKKFWGQQKKLYTQVTESCDRMISDLKSYTMKEKKVDEW